MEFYWKLGILLLVSIETLQVSHSISTKYIGAVVEYHPVTHSTNEKKPSNINADNYRKIISTASRYSADILVFPESSLSIPSSADPKLFRSEAASYVPDPKDNITICDDEAYAYSLRTISCAARDHEIYVVVNHREKVDCVKNTEGCPVDDLLIFNTNVVFDRRGRVIARYRKYNLFGERGTNVTKEVELSTFETDFGVTFGQFICFDILFARPALNLTRQLGIRDIIYSSHWFSELPFLLSVQAQAGWAYVNDVNLLSSGYNQPRTVSGGSGVFLGREGFSHVLLETKSTNVLIVSEIPKVINGKRQLGIDKEKTHVYEFNESEINTTFATASELFVPLIDDLSIYTTKSIDLKSRVYEETVCNRDLCCDFKFEIDFNKDVVRNNIDYYKYRMAVFNGTRTFTGVSTGGINSCGIISCANETLESCGRLIVSPSKPTAFLAIEITMRNINDDSFFMPVSLTSELTPLNATDYAYAVQDSTQIKMNLIGKRNDLVSFGIFGRVFKTDGEDVTINSVNVDCSSLQLVLLIFACIWAFNVFR